MRERERQEGDRAQSTLRPLQSVLCARDAFEHTLRVVSTATESLSVAGGQRRWRRSCGLSTPTPKRWMMCA